MITGERDSDASFRARGDKTPPNSILKTGDE
jgi:hypothetical protein